MRPPTKFYSKVELSNPMAAYFRRHRGGHCEGATHAFAAGVTRFVFFEVLTVAQSWSRTYR